MEDEIINHDEACHRACLIGEQSNLARCYIELQEQDRIKTNEINILVKENRALIEQNKAMLDLLKEFTFYIKGMRSCINVNDNDKYKLNQIIESNLKLIADIEGQNDQL